MMFSFAILATVVVALRNKQVSMQACMQWHIVCVCVHARVSGHSNAAHASVQLSNAAQLRGPRPPPPMGAEVRAPTLRALAVQRPLRLQQALPRRGFDDRPRRGGRGAAWAPPRGAIRGPRHGLLWVQGPAHRARARACGTRVIFCRICLKCGPNSTKCGPTSARFGPIVAGIGRCRPLLKPNSANLDRCRPHWTDISQI